MKNTKTELNIDKISNVLICGLGGVGSVCASSIYDNNSSNLKILIDKARYTKYKQEPTTFNNKEYNFDYILPDDSSFKADLVIIATKYDGLSTAIKNIKNFITERTIIISLLNGIVSEEEIAKVYGWNNLLISFYLGNSCIRNGRHIEMNGNYRIEIGTDRDENKVALQRIINFFDTSNIKYSISENIKNEYWKKFLINVGVNQLCAATGLSLKEIRNNKELSQELKMLMNEARIEAELFGIKAHKEIYDNAVKFLFEELDDAHPSMQQDVENKRKTEVDLFAGTVIHFAQELGINTPVNQKIYTKIKEIENNYV